MTIGSIESGGMKDSPLGRFSSQSVDRSKMIAGARFDRLWKVWKNVGSPGQHVRDHGSSVGNEIFDAKWPRLELWESRPSSAELRPSSGRAAIHGFASKIHEKSLAPHEKSIKSIDFIDFS